MVPKTMNMINVRNANLFTITTIVELENSELKTSYMKQKDKYIGIIVFIKSVRYVKTYKFCVKHVMT